MATREERKIELTIISAQDVKKVAAFGQQTCYAVAYITENKKKSKIDKSGGLNPVWDEKMILTCDETFLRRSGKHVTVEIYSRGSVYDKLVGFAKVPLVEIADGAAGSGPKYLAYQLRRPSGKVQGIVNLSFKLGEKRTVASAAENYRQQFPNSYNRYTPEYDSFSYNAPASQQYPPPAFYQTSSVTARDTPPAVSSVYPPQRAARGETGAAPAGGVYPPPKSSSSSGADTSSASGAGKENEPVMAYPASGYGTGYSAQQSGYGQDGGMYPPIYGSGSNGYGSRYSGQQYYPGSQANDPYSYQQAYYGKPSRRQGGSSGLGLGLLGGALGGLLLGDVLF